MTYADQMAEREADSAFLTLTRERCFAVALEQAPELVAHLSEQTRECLARRCRAHRCYVLSKGG